MNITDTTNLKSALKSTQGRRCITKCHKAGQWFVHPVILQSIQAFKHAPACAVDPVPTKDPVFKTHTGTDMIYVNPCRMSDNDLYGLPNELENLLLNFYFSPSDFLENIYGIISFDQTINWTIENDYLPFDTIKRVHNCSWKAFGLVPGKITDLVLEYYYGIAKNNWLKDYVDIIQNKYSFSIFADKIPSSSSNISEQISTIIKNDFLTYKFFVASIKDYITDYQDKWDIISSHYGAIKKYIFGKLLETLDRVSDK